MENYAHRCDDHYINLTVNTALTLPSQRETLIAFFERVQKSFPTMKNFYGRDRSEIALEEEKVDNAYRWLTLEARRMTSGYVNPPSVDAAVDFHKVILDLAPYHLSLSPLDCQCMDLVFGFDFTYQGNHDQLLADTLGVPAAFERFLEIPSAQVVDFEPCLTLTFSRDCRLQCRVNIETRTNDYQVRTQDYPEEQISVYLTCRHYGVLPGEESFVQILDLLAKTGVTFTNEFLAPAVLEPLAKAITLR